MWWTELVFRKHVFAEPAVSLETIFRPVTSCQLLDDDQRGGPNPDWKPLFGVSDEFADLETMAGHDDLLRGTTGRDGEPWLPYCRGIMSRRSRDPASPDPLSLVANAAAEGDSSGGQGRAAATSALLPTDLAASLAILNDTEFDR